MTKDIYHELITTTDDGTRAKLAKEKLQTLRDGIGLDGETDLAEEIQRLERIAERADGSWADASADDDESPVAYKDTATGGSDGAETDEIDIYNTAY